MHFEMQGHNGLLFQLKNRMRFTPNAIRKGRSLRGPTPAAPLWPYATSVVGTFTH